jgi:hypothetical protein
MSTFPRGAVKVALERRKRKVGSVPDEPARSCDIAHVRPRCKYCNEVRDPFTTDHLEWFIS